MNDVPQPVSELVSSSPAKPPRPDLSRLTGTERRAAVRAYRQALAAYARARHYPVPRATKADTERVTALARSNSIADRLARAGAAPPVTGAQADPASTAGPIARRVILDRFTEADWRAIVDNLKRIALDPKNTLGALRAIEQIFDRVDGKPAQMVVQTGETELKVTVRRIGV